MIPGLKRPRPNTTANLMWGSPFRRPSGGALVSRKKSRKANSLPNGTGSVYDWGMQEPLVVRNQTIGKGERTFSPVPRTSWSSARANIFRKGGMWDHEVTRRIPHGISYLYVVGAELVRWRGLWVTQRSTSHLKIATQGCVDHLS